VLEGGAICVGGWSNVLEGGAICVGVIRVQKYYFLN
jgi:hypothetical protein